MKPNDLSVDGSSLKRARPSSFHLRAYNVGMADGSILAIKDKVDYHVLPITDGTDDANSDIPDRNFVLKIDEVFR